MPLDCILSRFNPVQILFLIIIFIVIIIILIIIHLN
jgi:hypothetical protein